MQLQPGGNALL